MWRSTSIRRLRSMLLTVHEMYKPQFLRILWWRHEDQGDVIVTCILEAQLCYKFFEYVRLQCHVTLLYGQSTTKKVFKLYQKKKKKPVQTQRCFRNFVEKPQMIQISWHKDVWPRQSRLRCDATVWTTRQRALSWSYIFLSLKCIIFQIKILYMHPFAEEIHKVK